LNLPPQVLSLISLELHFIILSILILIRVRSEYDLITILYDGFARHENLECRFIGVMNS